jgi:hypothetical protein
MLRKRKPRPKAEKSCMECLVNQIIGLLNSGGYDEASNELLCFYCICCADCSIPSMEHNWTIGFPRPDKERERDG